MRALERQEIEALLRDHVRGVHEELDRLFRGVEKALNPCERDVGQQPFSEPDAARGPHGVHALVPYRL